MSVYAEEHFQVDISKGLYISPTPDIIPTGFTMKQWNLFQNDRGTWGLRKGFTDITTVTEATLFTSAGKVASRFPIPENTWSHIIGMHSLVGGVSLPQLIFGYNAAAGPGSATVLHNTGRKAIGDTVDFNTQVPGSGYMPYAAAQYKDRIYFYDTTRIIRVTNWKYDGTAPAFTVSLLATLATGFFQEFSRAILTTYGDRLFAAYGSRICYTDIPASGGYPETWGASNFFELPTDNTGVPTVVNMIQLNGLLYIFTDKGVFVLNGKGSTSGWRIDFLTDAVKIITENNVALVNGVFIATDRRYLYAFDGTSVRKIGTQIQYLFEVYNSFTIVPFEKGFIVSCRYMGVSSNTWLSGAVPGADTTDWPNVKTFYCDGSVWTEILTNAIGSTVDIIYGAVGKSNSSNTREGQSYIIYYDQGNAKYGIAYYNRNAFKDTLVSTDYNIVGSLRTKYIVPGIDTMYSLIKKWYTKVFSLVTTVTGTSYRDGIYSSVATSPTTLSSQADNNYLVQYVGVERATRVSVEITASAGSTPSIFNTNLPDSVPAFEIKTITLVGDSNKRDSTESVET